MGDDHAKHSQAVDHRRGGRGRLVGVGVGAIGGAVAQAPQRAPALAQDGLVSGYNAAPFDVGGRLGDRQQLQHYFLDGSRDRLR